MPFNEILNLGISGVPTLTDNAPVKTDDTSIDFFDVLETLIDETPELKHLLNDLDIETQSFIDKKIDDINISAILWQLMTNKNVHSFEARLIGGEKGWGNISSTVEKTGDVKVGDEIEGIEKASVELMRVILGLISRLKNQIINTQVNPDAHISNLSEKDLLPDLNQKTPEPPEVLIQKETFPHISVHTNKTITVVDKDHNNEDAPTDTRQPEIDPILTVPTFIPDGTYKVEVTIINNNLKETGQEENNHIWRGPEVVAENRTLGVQTRDVFYVTNTKEVAPDHSAFNTIEKGQVDQGIIKDIISINESPSKTKTVSHTYHSDRDISQTELDERIKEVRISIGTDAMGSSFNGRDENMPHIMEEKEMAKIVHEKTGTRDKPSDTAGDRIAFNDALDKNVLHIKDDIQGQIRPVVAQKIEEIVERYSEVKKSGDMLIRFKIDNGEILELNLKNNGENILIQIKSTNSELISMFTNQRDMIIKSLEEKNIFASIFINPDGANNQEKQEEKQRNSRYRPGKIPTDGFSEILEAQV